MSTISDSPDTHDLEVHATSVHRVENAMKESEAAQREAVFVASDVLCIGINHRTQKRLTIQIPKFGCIKSEKISPQF